MSSFMIPKDTRSIRERRRVRMDYLILKKVELETSLARAIERGMRAVPITIECEIRTIDKELARHQKLWDQGQ